MKNRNYTVYKHTSPEGKVYIGCTSEKPKDRWNKGYPHNKDFHEDIERLGWDNFKHDILASEMSESDAYGLEKELIHEYDSTNPKRGYNKSIGGKVNSGMIRSDEYRRKMSESLKGSNHPMYGKHHTEKSKRKMSESTRGKNHYMYGKHISEETKRKLSISHRRENLSEETLNKMRRAHAGKPLNEKTKQKLIESHLRKVMCIETGETYNSIKEAAMDVGCYSTNISAACHGRQNTARGYHWKYVD